MLIGHCLKRSRNRKKERIDDDVAQHMCRFTTRTLWLMTTRRGSIMANGMVVSPP